MKNRLTFLILMDLFRLTESRSYQSIKRKLVAHKYNFNQLYGIFDSWMSFTTCPFKPKTNWGYMDYHYIIIGKTLKLLLVRYRLEFSPDERDQMRNLIWNKNEWIEDGVVKWKTDKAPHGFLGRIQLLKCF